jgi:dihydroorotate dehydrogenase (fumarate)
MDLSTEYLGLKLSHPLIAGAGPLSREISSIRALEDAGIAAIVLYSLFEEQIEHENDAVHHHLEHGTETFAEALSYLPDVLDVPRGPHEYLEHIRRAVEAVNVPIIASLNGHTPGGWTEYARLIEEAGAHAIELNLYQVATDPHLDAAAIESRYVEIVDAVKGAVKIPVAVKLSPYFTALAHFARRLDEHGADGLVLFNRFYQPDVDLERLEVVPNLTLSAPHESRLSLRWIAILDPIVRASLAATTGVYDHLGALKLVMAGADVTMLVAALLRGGTAAIGDILIEMDRWSEEHEYASIRQMKGSMNLRATEDPGAFERANYMKALQSYC